MQLPPDTRNTIERPVLAGYSQFFQHLASTSKQPGIPYTLDEFGWELGTYVLRKADADKVMAFLGDLGRAIEAEEITLRFNEEFKSPVVWLNGRRFPNTDIHVNLGIRQDYQLNVVNSAGAETKTLGVVPKKFEGTDDYHAWARAMYTLSQKGEMMLECFKEHLFGANDYLGMNHDMNDGVRFFTRADLNFRKRKEHGCTYTSHDCNLSLNEIFDRTIVAAEIANAAYLVTERLPRLKQERTDNLTAKLVDGIL